jgi:hypothetical protein
MVGDLVQCAFIQTLVQIAALVIMAVWFVSWLDG